MIFFCINESLCYLFCMLLQPLIGFFRAGQLMQAIVEHFPLSIIPCFYMFEVLFELLHLLLSDFFVVSQGLVFVSQLLEIYFVAIKLVLDFKTLLFQRLYLIVPCFYLVLVLHLGLYELFYLFFRFSLGLLFPFLGLNFHSFDAIFILLFCQSQSISHYIYLLVPLLHFLFKFFPFLLNRPTLFLDLIHFPLQMIIFLYVCIQFFQFHFMLLLQHLKISTELIELLRIFINSLLKLTYLVLFFSTFFGSLMTVLLTITSKRSFHLLLLSQFILQSFNLQAQGLNNRLLDYSLHQLLNPHDGKLLSQWALLQGLQELILQHNGVKTSGKFQHYYSKNQQLTDIVQTSKREVKLSSFVQIRVAIFMRIPSAYQLMFVDNVHSLLLVSSLRQQVLVFPHCLCGLLFAELQFHRHKLFRCYPIYFRIFLVSKMGLTLSNARQ